MIRHPVRLMFQNIRCILWFRAETLYSLEQRYGISHDEMMKFNPALQNGLKAGMKLKIRQKAVASVEPVSVPGNVVLSKYKVEKVKRFFRSRPFWCGCRRN